MNTLFTIGHSTHESAIFVDFLLRHAVAAVADVRSVPYSRHHPQFNRECIADMLNHAGITYVFMGHHLGARPKDPSCYAGGRVRFELLAKTAYFQEGLARLCNGLGRISIALMCAEKDPILCHRTILVCRHLKTVAVRIHHILEDGTLEDTASAETRLLQLVGLPSHDLFKTRAELVEDAYDRQGERMAYQVESESGAGTEEGA